MMTHPALPQRILDEVNRYAPTFAVVQANIHATAAWNARAMLDPTGIEAQGLNDILAVQRKLVQLFLRNTLDQSKTQS